MEVAGNLFCQRSSRALGALFTTPLTVMIAPRSGNRVPAGRSLDRLHESRKGTDGRSLCDASSLSAPGRAKELRAATAAAPLEPPQGGALRSLSGWGRTSPSVATVREVRALEDVVEALERAPARGVLARGLGRSYGDLAQNGGGLVLEMTGFGRILDFDRERGVVTVQAGCSLGRLIEECLPAGWFLPVTPGTRHVTVGGAIACDVHGKNHHRDGSFGAWVLALTLITPGGEILRLTPGETPRRFWATVGALGLTGVVLEATVQLLRVETPAISVDVERSADLGTTLARLRESDGEYQYSVAWVDFATRSRRFGRSVLLRGNHARSDQLPARHDSDLGGLAAGSRIAVPGWFSAAPLLRSPFPILFNELYFRRAREQKGTIQALTGFFYPLDVVNNWNELYGRGGFLQYQFVLPFGAEETLEDVLRQVAAAGRPLLAVLKQFGPAAGPLSFPMPGWTVTLDLQLPAPRLARALDRADEAVAAAGGRVYLAKDSRLRRELLAQMYPGLDAWREVQAELDPGGRMHSDLARRLHLTGGRSA